MDDSVRAHEATVTAAPPADVREDETKITNAVRRAIIADTSLSSSARGVQIVTAGTRVTLRGRVATTRERSAIEAWAKRTSGVTEVDDQIEVQSAQ